MNIAIGIAFIAIYASIVFYIGRSGWSWMRPASSPSRLLRIAYIAALVFLALSFMLARVFEGSAVLHVIGSYWLAVFSLLALWLPVVHLLVWLARLTPLPRHRVHKGAGYATLGALALFLAFGSFNAYSPTVRTYEVHIDKPGPANGRLHIVMASDMHFSYLSGRNHALRMVAKINALKPDIVLFPGDIVDDDIGPYKRKGIGDVLAGIQAPYGVYASLGNHDRYGGATDELIELLEESGMRVLYDESVVVDGWLTIVGRRDFSDTERAELAELTGNADPGRPLFLLEHQPREFDRAQQLGVDLVLSGHTHHGQIAPGNLVTQRLFENDWGYLRKEQLHSIVSSGYGFWGPPIRIGSRSEIVSIQATFA